MGIGTGTFDIIVRGITVHVTPKRVKNIYFRVGGDGTARMSVPLGMPRAEAERIAQAHAPWFERNVSRAQARKPDAPTTWKTGDRLMVWGEPHVLRVEESGGPARCEARGGELLVAVPPATTAGGRASFVERWLAMQLRDRLVDLLPACEQEVGRKATQVTLRRMKSRWGSCTVKTGRIRLNTALAECPPQCLRMVLIHELCHLLEANHGQRFHALMDLHCPDWRATQRWLDEHPPRYP